LAAAKHANAAPPIRIRHSDCFMGFTPTIAPCAGLCPLAQTACQSRNLEFMGFFRAGCPKSSAFTTKSVCSSDGVSERKVRVPERARP
jgi:hypothetical protein